MKLKTLIDAFDSSSMIKIKLGKESCRDDEFVSVGLITISSIQATKEVHDYNVKKLVSLPGGYFTVYCTAPICSCYRSQPERHYLTEFEKGEYYGKYGKLPAVNYVAQELGRCYGTKDIEVCSCCGDKTKCNLPVSKK